MQSTRRKQLGHNYNHTNTKYIQVNKKLETYNPKETRIEQKPYPRKTTDKYPVNDKFPLFNTWLVLTIN